MTEQSAAPGNTSSDGSAFERVLDRIGLLICDGALRAGDIFTVDELVVRTGASRSIVREAVRVLAAAGLLTARRRVGLRVLEQSHWDAFNPLVVRWRLESSSRQEQLRDLIEVRSAIEPEAARLAATRLPASEQTRLTDIASHFRNKALMTADEGFLTVDTEFHLFVLRASGNALFARFGSIVEEALRDRAMHERAHLSPDATDLQLHIDVAEHILSGRALKAEAAMRTIIRRTSASPPDLTSALGADARGGAS